MSISTGIQAADPAIRIQQDWFASHLSEYVDEIARHWQLEWPYYGWAQRTAQAVSDACMPKHHILVLPQATYGLYGDRRIPDVAVRAQQKTALLWELKAPPTKVVSWDDNLHPSAGVQEYFVDHTATFLEQYRTQAFLAFKEDKSLQSLTMICSSGFRFTLVRFERKDFLPQSQQTSRLAPDTPQTAKGAHNAEATDTNANLELSGRVIQPSVLCAGEDMLTETGLPSPALLGAILQAIFPNMDANQYPLQPCFIRHCYHPFDAKDIRWKFFNSFWKDRAEMEFLKKATAMNNERGLDLTADEADLSMDSIATAEAQGKSTKYDDATYVNEERTPVGLLRRVQPRRTNRNIVNEEEADELPQIAEDTSVVDEPAEQHSIAGDSNASTLSQLSTCSDNSQKATAFHVQGSSDESDEDSRSHDESHSVAGTVQSPGQQLQELGPSTPASAPAPSPTPTPTSTPTTTPTTTPASTPGPEAALVRQSARDRRRAVPRSANLLPLTTGDRNRGQLGADGGSQPDA
ncbi:hypothetical protein C8Q77DRAFT_505724 [Trametes polyzona]|nr:hypothetical protein C8Q77DRAFT_505724 [Trametes polyzona]